MAVKEGVRARIVRMRPMSTKSIPRPTPEGFSRFDDDMAESEKPGAASETSWSRIDCSLNGNRLRQITGFIDIASSLKGNRTREKLQHDRSG